MAPSIIDSRAIGNNHERRVHCGHRNERASLDFAKRKRRILNVR